MTPTPQPKALSDQQLQTLRNLGNEAEQAADEIDSLRAEVEQWRKLKDPAVMHANLVRGLPADLTPEQRAHIAAGQMADQEAPILALRAEVERIGNNRDMWKGQCERQAAELERMRAGVERLRADAEHIANIAHAGGLCGLPEGEALSLIRKLTCRYWPRGKGMKDRVRSAINAAREAKG